MILVTGASGKTGLSIIQALIKEKFSVRAFINNLSYRENLLATGVSQISMGNIESLDDLRKATSNIEGIYHICPNMHPKEFEIGKYIIQASEENGVKHFVYHSVFHPQASKMPHHWKKLQVEEALLESKLNYTLVQPTAYMQNIEGYWSSIQSLGSYELPYPPETKISLVDLLDVAEAVAKIFCKPEHYFATYELVGTKPISQSEIALELSRYLGKYITTRHITLENWQNSVRESGLSEYALTTLLAMFEYYKDFGLYGNSNVLSQLLGREPNNLDNYLKRIISREASGE
jgi:uncharacterized protein YbjT (DUF2867 family)